MGALAIQVDERVKPVHFTEDTISVDLMDGCTITVPLVWYPRLVNASPKPLAQWEIFGGSLQAATPMEPNNGELYHPPLVHLNRARGCPKASVQQPWRPRHPVG
ncbi:MAG: hypothetical protein RLZZ597_3614 [Cyanobacteriota bacterium]|jgi:hypothetical protein